MNINQLILLSILLCIICSLQLSKSNEHFNNSKCSILNDNICKEERNRVTDKYNLNDIRGQTSTNVNIDHQTLYNNKNVHKKWNPKCLSPRQKVDLISYNHPDYILDKHKIEFSDELAEKKRVEKSFKIDCSNSKDNINKKCKDNYYSRLIKKRIIDKLKNKIESKKVNDYQKQTENNIYGVNYNTAEQYYENNYNYDISPLNTENWYLPANYVEYSEYNRPLLDKKIVVKDKYRTRALNWHFGKPMDS